jgi:single-stranded-DNA-specific exonuclease
LIEVSGLKPPFAPSDIGFGLGPRLNAAGRLGSAQAALELLLQEEVGAARRLAGELDRQNRERRAVEDRVFAEADAQVARYFDPENHAAIVAGAAGWHPGVVGIVASRVLRKYHRPTVIIGFDDEGWGKGSGRSIEGLSLVEALGRCREHLEKFGGHEMAAGVTLRGDRLDAFRDAFVRAAGELLTREQLTPRLRLDAELPLREAGLPVLEQLAALEPFGIGNHAPLFFARGVSLSGEPRVMKEKHLSLVLRQAGRELRAVWFGAGGIELPRLPWDVAFTIERNAYQGIVSAQIQLKSVRSSQ